MLMIVWSFYSFCYCQFAKHFQPVLAICWSWMMSWRDLSITIGDVGGDSRVEIKTRFCILIKKGNQWGQLEYCFMHHLIDIAKLLNTWNSFTRQLNKIINFPNLHFLECYLSLCENSCWLSHLGTPLITTITKLPLLLQWYRPALPPAISWRVSRFPVGSVDRVRYR